MCQFEIDVIYVFLITYIEKYLNRFAVITNNML